MDTVNTAPSAPTRSVRVTMRRVMFFGLTVITSGCATALLVDVLAANGVSAVEILGLLLFFGLFTWISGSLWTAIAGFIVQLVSRDPLAIDLAEVEGRVLHTRTAVVIPIYNEDTARVEAGLDATWESLSQESEAGAFDLFIMSDTTDAAVAREEEAMWPRFAARHNVDGRVFYRRRIDRSGRKAGNVLDFVKRWGANYECMVVLDADSVMSGHALVTMARVMEARPRLGILQSLPLAMGRESLFARLIQFGSRLQSQMLCTGLAYWQVADSNYWGHNAIIRIRPFDEFCHLPKLSGKPPLGGEILSHDFVEAAFMRRAGYEVRVLPQLMGSWEEVPANVIDYAARDRRWTQGNLQHTRVVRELGHVAVAAAAFIGAERHRGGQAPTVLPPRSRDTAALAGGARGRDGGAAAVHPGRAAGAEGARRGARDSPPRDSPPVWRRRPPFHGTGDRAALQHAARPLDDAVPLDLRTDNARGSIGILECPAPQ
jgi:membrane glycosyltransferase